ncbi:cyclic nucleotide-gated ion channel 1-like isoform X2 [Carya illinoinensis]|uniref:cyclic nucleotide-gated ion channel 1-like isoform X2 n=1 Tax=Carya illinoinensis TaxID=32201 RepID=UPI001C7199C7|nr:cyclic nucleotide-gated ion channel 1-like isoform X2 [Carya illinoinensis]
MSRRWNSRGNGRVSWDVDIERQGPKNDGTGSEKKASIKMAIGQVNHPLMMKNISKTPWWLHHEYFHWDVAFLVVCVVAIAVDPLFFYLPVIEDKFNEDTKCIRLNTNLEIIAICVRSFLDLIAIGDLIARKINNYPDMKCSDYVINILSILPFPQVIVPIIFSEMRDYEARFERRFLNAVVLLQYVPRIFRIYRLWKIVNETIILPKSSVNGESNKNMKGLIVMKAGFNLFLYLVAGHVLGAFWYFFSIERETTCWQLACRRHDTNCSKTSFRCHGGIDNNILNTFCSIEKVEKPNITLVDFGIFQEARESGTLLASRDFPEKAVFCFWWALRNLSSFGQNLITSPFYLENWFSILIGIFGLLLFLYFIGNLQVPIFEDESEELLYEITYKFLKQVHYNQSGYIVREGEPLDALIFIVKGIAWTYTSNHGNKADCLKAGDLFGRHLVDWVLESPTLSDIPLSTRTLKCHTKVEGFYLLATDLKDIMSQFWWKFSKFRHMIAQSDSEQLKHFVASSIQAAWRRRAIHPHKVLK